MHVSLLWLITVGWPLEDRALQALSQPERDDWNSFHQRMCVVGRNTGIYYLFAQTAWY